MLLPQPSWSLASVTQYACRNSLGANLILDVGAEAFDEILDAFVESKSWILH